MKTKFYLAAWLLLSALVNCANAQAPGDFKSNGTGGGAWYTAATWLLYNGAEYVPAPAAPSGSSAIRIQAGDTVSITSATTLSSLTIDSSAALLVAPGQTATLASTIRVNGTFAVSGTLLCNTHVINGKGIFILNAGASLNIGSSAGISSKDATGNIQTATRQFNPGANYTFSSTLAQSTGDGLPANLTGMVVANNANTVSGLTVTHNISIKSPGSFVVPVSRVLTCRGNVAITGTGSFLLNSGATFYIGHAAGISSAASTGCVQVTGTRLFSADANYVYTGSAAQVTGTALPSPLLGVLTIANTSGAGCTLSKDLLVNTPGRVIVTGSFGCATYILGGSGSFTLNTGATLLTGHALGLSATGTSGSIQTAAITYNTNATYVYNGAVAQTTGDGLPAAVSNLTISNTNGGVKLSTNITVNTNLTLAAGTLCLNGRNLTIAAGRTITRQGGVLSLCSGNLVYAGTVNLTYTGSNNLSPGPEVPTNPALLNNLTVALSTGRTLTLSSNVTVNGSVFMTSGSLALGGNVLTYAPAASLIYNGTAAQITSAEWPDNAFSTNISIRNTFAPAGVSLGSNKKGYTGTLTVQRGGFLNSGAFILTGTGNINISAGGTFITRHAAGVSPEGAIQLTGTRTFATGSSYTFNGTVVQETGRELPLSVAELTISNTAATNPVVVLSNAGGGVQTISGTLTLASGVLDIDANAMSLLFHSNNTPISRTTGMLRVGKTASLRFGVDGFTGGTAFTLPDNLFESDAPELKNLVLNRTAGLTLGNQNLTLNGTLTLTTGILNLANTTLLFQDSDVPVEVGAGAVQAGASFQFGTNGHTGGNAFTLPDQLFTTPTIAHLTINRTNSLLLETETLTITGRLSLVNGTFSIGYGTLKLDGDVQTTKGSLTGGPLATIMVGGTGSSLTLPHIENGLQALAIMRPNSGGAPAVRLGANLYIHSLLHLGGGSLALDNHDLTLKATAAISGAAASRYIITSGQAAGNLIRYAATEPVLFPVGTTSYTPAFVSNSTDTAQAFRARVFDGVLTHGTTGAAHPASNSLVKKTWIVEKVVADSGTATIILQWNGSDEGGSYNRDQSYISNYKNTGWDTTAVTAVQEQSPGIFQQTWTGRTGFPAFSVQKEQKVVLVNWIQFGAVRSGPEVILKWTVGNAKGDRRFNIERSVNRVSYQVIGTLDASGTTASTVTYSFADQAPVLYQNSYYRIKQTGADSTFDYSQIVRVLADPVFGSFVYPVPVQDKLTIVLRASYGGWADVYLADVSGKIIKRQPVHLSRGNNSIILPMGDLPKGMYVVQVLADGKVYQVHKVLK